MAANSLSLNKTFPIKNADGTPFFNLVLRKAAYESTVMSLGDKISGDVYYKDNALAVTMNEYVEYNGVKFVLVNPPTIVKEGMVSDNSELKGMTKYSFTFYHPMYLLGNFPFSDVAVTQDEERYLSQDKKFSWIGYPDDYIAKLNKNLEGTEWIVVKSDRFPVVTDDILSEVMQFDDATIADALKRGYEQWDVPYVVDSIKSGEQYYSQGKRFKVVFGLPFDEIYENESKRQIDEPFVFHYGKGVGLKNNSRTPRNNKIITRLSGYGSEDNIPYGYPQIPWTGNQDWDYTINNNPNAANSYPIYKGIVGGAYVKLIKHPFTRTHLMPSVYTDAVNKKVNPNATGYDPTIELKDYYDAVSDATYQYPNPIVLTAPSYEIHEFEKIKPELDSTRTLAITGATPLNADLTPASAWDDTMDEDGNYVQSYFQVSLPALGFDIYACAAITQEMQINMRGGACLGCTFEVQVDWDDYKKNFYDENEDFAPTGSQRDYTKFPDSTNQSINLILKKETSTFGTLMPNIYQYPQSGDIFVILGISLPLTYITEAEQRLDAEMKSYMLENNIHYYDYPLKFDEYFLTDNPYILAQIKPNSVVHFDFAGEEMELYVKQLSVKYENTPLPKYDITLTDDVEITLNSIGQAADDIEKLGALISVIRQNYSRNVWAELSKKLSKTQDDTAQGFIRMLQGIQVGANYVPDILGEGGVFRKDSDGKIVLVTDKLYARVKAYFDSVEIKDYKHTSGNRIASKAGIKCTHVEWIDANGDVLEQTSANESNVVKFRCYFRAKDGTDSITNDFVASATGQQDLAFCDKTSMDAGINQRRYWRAVVGKNGTLGEDDEFGYIDLSKSDCETGSDFPMAEDDIIQLGNRTDDDRKGAIIEYVGGADAPSYQIYQGINSYSLTNKNYISLGYSSQTGRAYMNVYGDFRFGNRSNEGSYISYNAGNEQLDIKARINAQSTIGNQTLPQYIQANQNNYNDAWIQSALDDLQSQIDGEIDSWFYNYLPVSDINSKVPLTNVEPYKTWYEEDGGGTASEVTTERTKHLGDTFYDNSSGYAFRFSLNESTSAFEWNLITDSAVVEALANAARAQETADGKRTVYSVWNAWMDGTTNTLKLGDLFIPTDTTTTQSGVTYYASKVYKCIADGTSTFEEINYTDDSAFKGYINAILNGSGASGDAATVAAAQKAIKDALGGGTIVDGGLLLTSLIAMRKFNATTQQYTTWAGISGTYQDSETGTGYKGHGIAAWYGGEMTDKEVVTEATDYAKSLFRFDGSGYLASGNITWDKDGNIAIKDITALMASSNNTDLLNELIMFNNAFHFNTQQGSSSTIINIAPQYPFTQLSIYDNGTARPVATQKWVSENYISVAFFNRIFQAYSNADHTDAHKIVPNDVTTTINNLKILVGTWTDQYLSALGLNPNSGSGGATAMYNLVDVLANSAGNAVEGATAGNVLTFDNGKWKGIAPTTGTVTSIGMTVPTGLSVSPATITGSGTFAITFASGYKIPETSKQTNWDTAYGWGNHATQGYLTSNSIHALTIKSVTGTTETDIATYNPTTGVMTFAIVAGSNISLTNDAENHKVTIANTYAYSLPTASSSTKGGVKVGDTLAISSAVLNLKSGIATAGTYRSVTVDTYGRVTAGTNPTTLSGYGITDAKIVSGVITLGSNTITPVTSVAMTMPQGFTVTGSPISKTGTLAVSYTNGYEGFTTDLKSKINALYSWFEVDANGNVRTKDWDDQGTTKHRGFYSYSFVSALGQSDSSGGGGGGATALADLTDVTLTSPSQNQILVFNGTHWVNQNQQSLYVLPAATSSVLGGIKIGYSASGKNYAVQLDANNNAFVNVPWTDTTYTLAGLMGSSAIGGATQPIYWNGSAFVNTTYTLGKSVPSDAVFTDTNTWRNILLAGTQKLGNGTDTKGLNFVGDGKTTISFLAAGTGSGTSGSSNYATIQISSTWRGIQDNLTSDSTTDSLSAKQGKALYGYITTLQGYFTSGVANSAAKLSTVSKTAWGQTYWTSGGVPTDISGDMTGVDSIDMTGALVIWNGTSKDYDFTITWRNVSNEPYANLYAYENGFYNLLIGETTGTNSLVYDASEGKWGVGTLTPETKFHVNGTFKASGAVTLASTLSVASGITLTTTKKIYFGDTSHYIELDSNGYFHFSHGLYSDSFVSALGLNSSGGGGGGGATALYGLLDVLANSAGTAVDGASAGNVLTFDSTAGKWKGAAPNNGALYLQASGTTKVTFTANQSGQSTFNIAEGSANGTISVGGTNVAIHGLGSRAYDSTSYLPLSGGTISSGSVYSLYINNSASDSLASGIRFQVGGTTYGALYINSSDSELYYNGYKVWNNNNDGAGSGLDADLLDGKHDGELTASFFKLVANGTNPLDANTLGYGAFRNYSNSGYWQNTPLGMTYGYILALTDGNNNSLMGQLAWDISHDTTATTGNLWWRAKDSSGWTNANWRQVAFTDMNVASATKLKTARSIFGHDFDGTVDVTGVVNNAVALEFNYVNSSAGHGGYIDFHFNGSTADYTSRIIEDASGTLSLMASTVYVSGYLGVGITPSYKLDVNGTVNGNAFKIKDKNMLFTERGTFSTTGTADDIWFLQGTSTARTVIYDSNYIALYSKVRIGDYSTSAAPSYTLDVSGGISLSGGIHMEGANWRTINVERTNVGVGSLGGIDGNGMYFYHQVSGGSSSYMYLKGGVGLSVNGNISTSTSNGSYVRIGALYLSYDSTNNALRVSANANGTGAANFYAIGAVSALGANTSGGGGSATSLYELLDVTANSGGTAVEGASGGNVLTYDSSTSKWKGKALENLSFYVYNKDTIGVPVSPTSVYNGKTAVTLNLASADAFVKATISGTTLRLFPANAGGVIAAATTLTTQDTWKAANTSQEGYVPKLQLDTVDTISSQTSEYVLVYSAAGETTPRWRKLPSTAFSGGGSGSYLPLTGGTLKGTSNTPLTIQTGVSSGVSSYIMFADINGNSLGKLGINAGTPRFMNGSGTSYAILTSDNWSSYVGTSTDYVEYATRATRLKTARTIWGQSFNGTANVTGELTDVGSINMTGWLVIWNSASKNYDFDIGWRTISNEPYVNMYAYENSQYYNICIGTTSAEDSLIFDASKGYWGVGTLSPKTKFFVEGDITASSYITNSDIRMKDVIGYNSEPNFESVANAPAILFTWKDKQDDLRHVGTIAQYWKAVLPEAVKTFSDGYLSMQYDVIALLSTISVAKKVQDHERRIYELERENERLRYEIEQIKAA